MSTLVGIVVVEGCPLFVLLLRGARGDEDLRLSFVKRFFSRTPRLFDVGSGRVAGLRIAQKSKDSSRLHIGSTDYSVHIPSL